MLPNLFWPTVRKNCSSDREKLLKFEAEGREFAKILRSHEQFTQIVKSQNNFYAFLTCSWRFLRLLKLKEFKFKLGVRNLQEKKLNWTLMITYKIPINQFCGSMDYGVGVVGSVFFRLFLWKFCGSKDFCLDVVGSVFVKVLLGHPFVLLGLHSGYDGRSLPGNVATIEAKVFSCKNK